MKGLYRGTKTEKPIFFCICIFLFITTIAFEIISFFILYKYRCSILCLTKNENSNFYSYVGVAIGTVVSLVVFVLGLFQTMTSLQEETFKGIEIKKIFKLFHFYYFFLLISIIVTFGLIGLVLTFYLKKWIFCSLKVCIILFFHAMYVVEIETSGILMSDSFLYMIIRQRAIKDIKAYESKIKKIKK